MRIVETGRDDEIGFAFDRADAEYLGEKFEANDDFDREMQRTLSIFVWPAVYGAETERLA